VAGGRAYLLRGGELTRLPAEIFTHDAAPGDRYLLSTAQIQDALSCGELRDVLRDTARDPQDVADDITAAAFPVKSWDGLTCVVADVGYKPGGSGKTRPKLAGTALTSGALPGPANTGDLA
jgi:PPM family protein phosphatase